MCENDNSHFQAILNEAELSSVNAKVEANENMLTFSKQLLRPSCIYAPKLSRDGNMWCALYGDDLVTGVAGFGKSPEQAYAAFDAAWIEEVDDEA